MSTSEAKTNETNTKAARRLALPSPSLWALIAALLGALVWASWPSLVDTNRIWWDDPRYSHGFFVPLFSLFLLYHRRDKLKAAAYESSSESMAAWWLGLPLIVVGAAIKYFGGRYFIAWCDGIALLPLLAGVTVVLGGLPTLRWAWPAIGFLFFMIPLPFRVENALGPILQLMATRASTFFLQLAGLPAQADQNVISLEDVKIGVVEACNGLGMLMMFFAYATAVAIVIHRPLLDKIIIMLSAAPIAMVANVLRITVTGLLHSYSTREIADHVYHELAGFLMMPMALIMFGGELFFLSKMFVEVDEEESDLNPFKSMLATNERAPAAGSPVLVDVRSIPKGSGSRGKSRD